MYSGTHNALHWKRCECKTEFAMEEKPTQTSHDRMNRMAWTEHCLSFRIFFPYKHIFPYSLVLYHKFDWCLCVYVCVCAWKSVQKPIYLLHFQYFIIYYAWWEKGRKTEWESGRESVVHFHCHFSFDPMLLFTCPNTDRFSLPSNKQPI